MLGEIVFDLRVIPSVPMRGSFFAAGATAPELYALATPPVAPEMQVPVHSRGSKFPLDSIVHVTNMTTWGAWKWSQALAEK